MDFGLTDEQEMLRTTAREFVADVCPAERAKEWDEQSIVPPELFKGMADMGWFGLPFAEEDGGDGGGPLELILIAEELGRASFDVAMCYIGVLIPGLTVFRWGSEAQRAFVREQVMTGRAPAGRRPERARQRVGRGRAAHHGRATRATTSWSTGRRRGAPAAACPTRRSPPTCAPGPVSPSTAGSACCSSTRRRRASRCAGPPRWRGTSSARTRSSSTTSSCPRRTSSARSDEGWKVMLSNIELEKVIITGGYLGAAQATLDEMLEYSRDRHAFGRPIGNFQALAHAMADLQTEIDSARLLAYRAAWLLAPGQAVHPGGLDGQAQGLGDLRRRPPGSGCRSAPATASPPRAS